MVNRHIARHGGDPRKSLSAIEKPQPARSVFEPIDDPDIQDSLSSLSSVITRRLLEAKADETESWGVIPPGADGRFQVLRLLDQGGMGIVYVAHDHEVNREVALKQLNEADATDAQKRGAICARGRNSGQP